MTDKEATNPDDIEKISAISTRAIHKLGYLNSNHAQGDELHEPCCSHFPKNTVKDPFSSNAPQITLTYKLFPPHSTGISSLSGDLCEHIAHDPRAGHEAVAFAF